MAKKGVIDIICFGKEIGKLDFDEHQNTSYFQYNEQFLNNNSYQNFFPDTGILKRIKSTQAFSRFNSETFRGLPPMIADSLPDTFGNIIFKKWLEQSNKSLQKISVLEQLTYVANRGMGALEFRPAKELPFNTSFNLDEIIAVLKDVMNSKNNTTSKALNTQALLNVFRMGSSAGGVRPKILISEHAQSGEVIPGDITCAADYNHYLVKLCVDEDLGYSREVVEYSYYLTAIELGIAMMPSKLIEQKHFATQRFDRQNGFKKHILTASGLTGWDFKSYENSSYENLFELALFLKIPHAEIEELFRRMIFNIVFCNTDDHLKNHTFIYNENKDKWNLAPAYDLTYALNPLMNYKRISRALSINNKRIDITLADVLTIAEKYTIKSAKSTIIKIQDAVNAWKQKAQHLEIPQNIVQSIYKDFIFLIK